MVSDKYGHTGDLLMQALFCRVLGDYTAAFGALINKQCFADPYFGFTIGVNPGQLSLF